MVGVGVGAGALFGWRYCSWMPPPSFPKAKHLLLKQLLPNQLVIKQLKQLVLKQFLTNHLLLHSKSREVRETEKEMYVCMYVCVYIYTTVYVMIRYNIAYTYIYTYI